MEEVDDITFELSITGNSRPKLHCGNVFLYPNVNKQLDSNCFMKSMGTFYQISLML